MAPLFDSVAIALKEHANLLTGSKYQSALLHPLNPGPLVESQVNGYQVGFGARRFEQNRAPSQYAFFIRVRLKNPPKVPLYLIDNVDLNHPEMQGLKLQWGWLVSYKNEQIDSADFVEKLEKDYLANVLVNMVKLVDIAQKVDINGWGLDKRIDRIKRAWIRDLVMMLVLVGIAILGSFVYCWKFR